MPTKHIPAYIRRAHANPRTRTLLISLVDGTAWPATQEQALARDFVQGIVTQCNENETPIDYTLACRIQTAARFLVLAQRHENDPQNHDSDDLKRLAALRSNLTQFRITLNAIDQAIHRAARAGRPPSAVGPASQIPQPQPRASQPSATAPPSQNPPLLHPLNTTIDDAAREERERYLRWRRGPFCPGDPIAYPVPKGMTSEQLAELDRLYGPPPNHAIEMRKLYEQWLANDGHLPDITDEIPEKLSTENGDEAQ